MHFVTRSNLETAYNSTGYALRQDPLAIFKQPPMRHSRSMSVGSAAHLKTIHGGSPLVCHRSATLKESEFEDVRENDTLMTSGQTEVIGNHVSLPLVENALDHDCKIAECRRIVINVAGQKYETQLKTINRLPSTLLGNPDKREQYWDSKREEYFFDRHRPSFPAILYYYQSGGRLKRPVEVPVDTFMEELQFYELGNSVIEHFKRSEGIPVEEDYEFDDDVSSYVSSNRQGIRETIWRTFESPGSSKLSTIVAILSVALILTSICTFCVETLPPFKNSDCSNVTQTDINGTLTIKLVPNFTHPLFIIESCCIAWFVFELVIRATTCPSITRFLKDVSNWIDLISITPYFLFLTMFFLTSSCNNDSKIFSVLRVFRVARIFKLGRFSDGLRVLAKTLQVSFKELFMFVLFLCIGVVIFAAAIYFVESPTNHENFHSIPDSFWWAVISMTTVGYGDVFPVSVLGKVVGSMCVLSGLLCIALPVPVIVTNFNNIYRQSTGRGNNL